jgi:hypothetical protein
MLTKRVSLTKTAVAQSTGLRFFPQDPGVPLRSTPGFMLSPAQQAEGKMNFKGLNQ